LTYNSKFKTTHKCTGHHTSSAVSAYLPCVVFEPVGGSTTEVCNAWPVWR